MKFDFNHLLKQAQINLQKFVDGTDKAVNTVSNKVNAYLKEQKKNGEVKGLAAVASRMAGTHLSSRFKGVCVVGLNKTEFMTDKNEPSLHGEHWQDMIDDASRRNTALLFFAPRDLSGSPVNPYLFLAGDDVDIDDEEEQALFMQNMGNLALFDFCRLPPVSSDEVGIILAADMLFHWDNEDNYIIPTTVSNWPRDVKRITSGYRKNTHITLYTHWNTDIFADPPINLNIRPLQEAPLVENTWVNQPTFQEKHGTRVLLLSILFAFLFAGGLFIQRQGLSELDEEIGIVEQQIPREGKYIRLARPIREQEAQMRYRHLFPVLVQDVARTIQLSEMKIDNFEIRNPKPQSAPRQMIATIEAERAAYQGWLQEEPVAKNILINSATFSALRKPPGNSFKLEGLINLDTVNKNFSAAQKRQTENEKAAQTATQNLPNTGGQ